MCSSVLQSLETPKIVLDPRCGPLICEEGIINPSKGCSKHSHGASSEKDPTELAEECPASCLKHVELSYIAFVFSALHVDLPSKKGHLISCQRLILWVRRVADLFQ